ncbi:MAG: hypothetical protein JWQ80_2834 [Massilia sp.]|nr:hypothetical protein [Massilia sp.]
MNNFLRAARGLGAVALAVMGTACSSDSFYRQRNLVADGPAIVSEQKDPNLVNAWGIAFNPFGWCG